MLSAERELRLQNDIHDYLEVRDSIKTGLERQEEIAKNRDRILAFFGADLKDWYDYRWQLKHRITDAETLSKLMPLSKKQAAEIDEVGLKYRYAISPYYLSLIDSNNPECPVARQSIPMIDELDSAGETDPMDEENSSPVPGVTRRYPDRLIIKVTNQCGMYCRFCQRRRLIGEQDVHSNSEKIKKAIEYVRDHEEIRDVLITGGDAFMLSDQAIDNLLADLRSIKHVEIIRFGTRTPVTLPQRITPELVSILKKYHPVYVNTHFNSPAEISDESKAACERLADAGIPLGNQMVLLNGVNNKPHIVKKLNQSLLSIRVKPYYIFHPKAIRGTSHFWCSIEEGLDVMESLRGYTSGMAIPTYIVNGTGGLGKTPLLPNYLLYIGRDKAVFRNWEGQIFEIENRNRSKQP
ncbi:MAG: KamA family radical SAM protein [Eubacteriales bacterium]|nr:KamA family radical SAM protein [Eubacteriales bacterium]